MYLRYFSLPLLLSGAFASPALKHHHFRRETGDWDYIIAGAGPAGLIVAERLVEANKTVLLLERGGPSTYSSGGNLTWDYSPSAPLTLYDVPGLDTALFETDMSFLCDDTPVYAACTLGGGVEINAMVFIHPRQADFDDKWPQGWQWSEMSSAAQKLYARNPGSDSPSVDGKIYDPTEYNILSSFLDTQEYHKVSTFADPNDKYRVYTHPPWNIKDGERAGPVRTYLPLAQKSSNFKLQMHTTVVRVTREGSVVTGVEVKNTLTGVTSIISVSSNARVILASGSMITPKILFNSGIGPSDQLSIAANSTNSSNFPAQKDWISLPVGHGLKDHPIVNVNYTTFSNLTAYDFNSPPTSDNELYLSQRSGPLAQGVQRLLFWSSFVGSDNVTRSIQGTTSVTATDTILVKFYLTHGLTSSGRLGLSADGSSISILDSPYFTTSADKEGLAGFIDDFNTAAKNSTILKPQKNISGAESLEGYTSGLHLVGTVKMGCDDGRTGGSAVVDLDTKVYGIDNLFVVDASIHPDLPTGNTQAIVMVVAERAAEKILALV
ncbi:MAG: hypothetical protein M1834_006386 [Cirrosporium novae-zelandiae]|nr:MAG: hypothetical protein M1834_006386 [Cirrosporium novae-zelandiae]